MDKIKFDHSKETISQTIGVSDERNDEIYETVKAVFKNDCDDVCKDLEQVMGQLNPASPAEYLLIGFKYGHIYRQLQQYNSSMIHRALLSNLLEPDAQKI